MDALTVQQQRSSSSKLARRAVWAVIWWVLIHLVLTAYFAATHHVKSPQHTTFDVVASAIVTGITAVAYIIVVYRAPSAFRLSFATALVMILLAASLPVVNSPRSGGIYGASDVVAAAVIGVLVAGPLVLFHVRRPGRRAGGRL